MRMLIIISLALAALTRPVPQVWHLHTSMLPLFFLVDGLNIIIMEVPDIISTFLSSYYIYLFWVFLARSELSPQNLQLLLQIEVKLSELLVGLMVHVGLTGLLAAPKARRRVIVVVTWSEV